MNRRDALKKMIGVGLFCSFPGLAPLVHAASNHSDLLATRFFPSPDYNRLTFEFKSKPNFSTMVLSNPDRLVVDLAGMAVSEKDINLHYDQYSHYDYNLIKRVRTGIYNNEVMRVVLELNQRLTTSPKVFLLDPIDMYKYRLVIDMYLNELEQIYLNQSLDELISSLTQNSLALPHEVKKTNTPSASGVQAAKPSASPRRDKPYLVMIDPGHGGEDPGAIGRGGSYEKNIVLAISKILHKKINQQPGYRAMLTRDRDFFIPLHVRVAKARQAKADMFISIHADASTRPDPYGASVYVLSENGASSVRARFIAKKENAADLIGGVSKQAIPNDLTRLLAEMSVAAQIAHSKIVATHILSSIGSYNKLHKRTVEQAGFAVLKAPNIPSVLVETGFISNPREERLLNTVSHQTKIADSILDSIIKYTTSYNV